MLIKFAAEVQYLNNWKGKTGPEDHLKHLICSCGFVRNLQGEGVLLKLVTCKLECTAGTWKVDPFLYKILSIFYHSHKFYWKFQIFFPKIVYKLSIYAIFDINIGPIFTQILETFENMTIPT